MENRLPERASLWRETMRDLKIFVKEEGAWIAVFIALIAIEQRLTFVNDRSDEIMEQLEAAGGDPSALFDIGKRLVPNFISTSIANAVMGALSTYVFTVLYLRRFVQSRFLDFTSENFFHWLTQIIRKYALLFFPAILASAVYGGVTASTSSDSVKGAATAVFFVFGSFWMFYFYYGLYLLYLVSPLALFRKKQIFKVSTEMTREHLWRIWWESMIVLGILYVVFLPLSILDAVISQGWGESSPFAHTLSALTAGFMESVSSASMAIYACITYRTLLRERNENAAGLTPGKAEF
jgi:hypothetical protein